MRRPNPSARPRRSGAASRPRWASENVPRTAFSFARTRILAERRPSHGHHSEAAFAGKPRIQLYFPHLCPNSAIERRAAHDSNGMGGSQGSPRRDAGSRHQQSPGGPLCPQSVHRHGAMAPRLVGWALEDGARPSATTRSACIRESSDTCRGMDRTCARARRVGRGSGHILASALSHRSRRSIPREAC